MKRHSSLIIGALFFSSVACAGGFSFIDPPASTDLNAGAVDSNLAEQHVYNSGDTFNGKPTFFYRVKGNDGYQIQGLPISPESFKSAADSKISIWQHIEDCDMGSYSFTSPATSNMCQYDISATCDVTIKCSTGSKWSCNFDSGIPDQLVEILKQDEAENLGIEAVTPYEDALYSSPSCQDIS